MERERQTDRQLMTEKIEQAQVKVNYGEQNYNRKQDGHPVVPCYMFTKRPNLAMTQVKPERCSSRPSLLHSNQFSQDSIQPSLVKEGLPKARFWNEGVTVN